MRMIFAVVVACWGGMMVAQTNDVVADVRMSVSTVVSSLPNGTADTVDRLRNFGVHAKHLRGYQNLVEAVSNNQDIVWSNFNLCATNELSRMMLLAAWWGGDDQLYLNGLSRSLDMAVSGTLTREEVDWYRSGHRNERRGNILALRYDEPGVSNLVMRYYGFMGETNACQRILSGEARRTLLRYFEDMAQ